MIDFHLDDIRGTKDRFGEMMDSSDRQHSEISLTYSTMKTKLASKIDSIRSAISKAESEKHQAQRVISHNNEVERRTKQEINELKNRIREDEQEKEKAQKNLSRAKKELSAAKAIANAQSQQGGGSSSSASSNVSSIQAEIADIQANIRELDEDIRDCKDNIQKLEKKLQDIARANRNLQDIIGSIDNTINQFHSFIKRLEMITSQMVKYKENYDSKYGMVKKGMPAVYERVGKAYNAANDALYALNQAGFGYAKELTIDSPSTLGNISGDLNRASFELSHIAYELNQAASRYQSYLKDNITAETAKLVDRNKTICEDHGDIFKNRAMCLDNAAGKLSWYLTARI